MRAPRSPLRVGSPLTRRAVLAGAVGAAGVATLGGLPRSAAAAGGLPTIPALPPGGPNRRSFDPLEQRFAGYLAMLAPLTNDIEDTDPATFGFMKGGWWREPAKPFNARVQEHVYTLSWFLANDRPWNPYYRSTALAARLDAALQHYLTLQNFDGAFSEYAPGESGLAATGFGINYLARTLANVSKVDGLISKPRIKALEAAIRGGIEWLLDESNPIWTPPIQWSNQVTAGLAGSTRALQLRPNSVLVKRLRERIEYLAAHGQSPAGFFYDPRGMDINYNFEVMLPELAEIHALTNSPVVLGMARRFTDWFGYNLLREPDGSGWLTYYAVSARTTTADYDDVIPDPDRTSLASLFVPAIPKLGAFFTAREDRAATREAWAADPAPVPVLTKMDTSPRIIAHAGYGEALPSTSEKQVAIRQVPYLRSRDFAEIRRDALTNQDFVYVRHPRYYAGAFFGWRATQDHVHAGPGFLWHPDAGTIIHAQQTATGCWSTVLATGHPDAENDLVAAYLVGGNAWGGEQVRPAGAAVQVRYRMPDSRVVTEFTLAPDSLTRSVRATTAATEQIPLVLLPTDVVSFANGSAAPYNQTTAAVADGLIVRRGSTTIAINWGTPRPATLSTSSRTYLKDARRRIHVLRIPHSGALDTRITL